MLRARTAPSRLVDVLLLLVAVVWGSTYLAAKEIVTQNTVLAVLALRFGITTAAMLPVCLSRIRRMAPDEALTGVLLGLILSTILTLETFGIARTTATNAGLIISLTIVMTPILESAVRRSWLPIEFFAAALMAVVGVVLLASGTGLHSPSLGDLLVLAAAAVRAVHITVMHRLSAHRKYDSLALTYMQMATAAATFCVLTLVSGDSIAAVVPRFDAAQWAGLVYLALIGTVFAFFVQMWAVRTTSPSRVSLLLGTEPIWALFVGVLVGGDRLDVAGVIGAGLILTGASWGQRIERWHREARPSGTFVASPRSVPSAPDDPRGKVPCSRW